MASTQDAVSKFIETTKKRREQGKKYIEYLKIEDAELIVEVLEKL